MRIPRNTLFVVTFATALFATPASFAQQRARSRQEPAPVTLICSDTLELGDLQPAAEDLATPRGRVWLHRATNCFIVLDEERAAARIQDLVRALEVRMRARSTR